MAPKDLPPLMLDPKDPMAPKDLPPLMLDPKDPMDQ
jgi:hypothetical protein